jgi:hypothetical protein
VKTDHEAPPDVIPAANKAKPSDIGNWSLPRGVITSHTPRSGREKEWFEVTGKVTLVKVEADGDLDIQLADADGSSKVEVVVEVPVKQQVGESPWDNIRKAVFGWTKTKFPFQTKGEKLTLSKKPVIKVEGYYAEPRLAGRLIRSPAAPIVAPRNRSARCLAAPRASDLPYISRNAANLPVGKMASRGEIAPPRPPPDAYPPLTFVLP